jgi:hypothetical protein
MTIRVAAIEVSHWHALHDAAYLRHLVAMPDVELVALIYSIFGGSELHRKLVRQLHGTVAIFIR